MSARYGVLAAALSFACAHTIEENPPREDDQYWPSGGRGEGGKAGGLSGAGKPSQLPTTGGNAGAGGSLAHFAGAAGRAGTAPGEAGASSSESGGAGDVETSGGGSVATANELEVEHKTGNSDPNDNQIRVGLRITSFAAASVALSALELRYYFTSEVALPLTIEIYDAARSGVSGYQTVSKDAVKAEVTSTNGYLSISFAAAAGALAKGDTLTLDVAVHGPNWTGNFMESNDYSFAAGHADFVKWDHVTLFGAQSLLWGNEPP